ncbi:Fc.00g050720.m01.CDS01 [Cosmosporella sp. VM-42]
MAEAAGLAVGGIALAGLLSTCVEMFEYFESARGYIHASNLGKTKISLLGMRLCRLADIPALHSHGEEEALKSSWPHDHRTIADSLCSIKTLLNSAHRLIAKYVPSSGKPHHMEPPRGKGQTSPGSADKGCHSPPRASRILTSVRHGTHWAIQDKKKLDSFIIDLEFLVTNLENLSIKHALPSLDIQLAMMNSVRITAEIPKNPTAGQGCGQATKPNCAAGGHSTPSSTTGCVHTYDGVESVGQSIIITGNVGDVPQHSGNYCYKDAKSNDQSFMILGNVAGTEFQHLLRTRGAA